MRLPCPVSSLSRLARPASQSSAAEAHAIHKQPGAPGLDSETWDSMHSIEQRLFKTTSEFLCAPLT